MVEGGGSLQRELEVEHRAAKIKASWENPVPTFEEQFSRREPGAIVDAVDVRPALQKTLYLLFLLQVGAKPHKS